MIIFFLNLLSNHLYYLNLLHSIQYFSYLKFNFFRLFLLIFFLNHFFNIIDFQFALSLIIPIRYNFLRIY